MGGHDPELYKDKIEISLDGRQVFYLFFGGAVIACLVFVLGVMVGRRVEARAHVDRGAPTTAARDPLTALDQLDAASKSDMSFRSTLAGGKAAGDAEIVAAIDKDKAEKVEKAEKAEKAAEAARAAEAAKKDEPKAEEKAAAAPEKDKDKNAEADEKDKKEAKKEPVKPAPEGDDSGGKFTLQLSSFKDKTEAESFLWDLKHSGYKAYLVEAEVEGKGRFWRVRFGRYDTYEAALDAKASFERKVNKIAYVTRL